MKNSILFASLTAALALGLAHAPALRADESDYAATMYDEDEAKEERSFLRMYLEPSHIPSPEYLESYKDGGWPYKGNETPEQLKAMSAKNQAVYDKIVAALPEKLSVPVAKKRKILVLTYRTGLWYHTAGAAGGLILLREAAKKYGAFELTERYKLEGIDAKMLSEFDAVVMNNGHHSFRQGKYGFEWPGHPRAGEWWEQAQKRTAGDQKAYDTFYNELLPAYVKNGGGLFGLHGALLRNTGTLEKPNEYGVMFGGQIDGYVHPWVNGKIAGGGTYRPVLVKILEPNNPITFAFRDAPNAAHNSELFSYFLPTASMDSSRTLVRYAYEDRPDVTYYPKSVERCKDFASSIIWIKSYGKGRVFYNALGHDEEIFTDPCVARANLDGLLYVTGDLKVPDAPATAASANK